MADNEDDKSDDKKPLTPEERIAKLEKGRIINWAIFGVLFLVIIIQSVMLFMVATQGPDPRVDDNKQELVLLHQEIELLESAYESAQAYNDNAQRLEEKLDRIMKTIQLNNFSSLRKLMMGQEQSFQEFVTALQQGMYDMSRMVRGSRTWFEVYKGDLDIVLKDSKQRFDKLSRGLVEPVELKRQTVKEAEAPSE